MNLEDYKMKIVLTENKFLNFIYKYIDSNFDMNEIHYHYGKDENDDGYFEIENKNFLIFYEGEWVDDDNSNIVFNYFTVDYYDDNPSSKSHRNSAPILEVMNEYTENLDIMFHDYWKEPMKKWFEQNTNLPVKTVSTYYI